MNINSSTDTNINLSFTGLMPVDADAQKTNTMHSVSFFIRTNSPYSSSGVKDKFNTKK